MMKNIETIKTELRWLFDAFNGEDIAIVVDEDNKLKVAVEFCDFNDVDDIEDVEYFFIYCRDLQLSADNFDACVDKIAHIEDYLNEHKSSEAMLYDYYCEHIANHTEDEFRLGNMISATVFDYFWKKTDQYDHLVDFLNAELDMILEQHYPEFNIETLRAAFELSRCWETYSDWYKDINYVRPHFY